MDPVFVAVWIIGAGMMGSVMILHTAGAINMFRGKWSQAAHTWFFGGMFLMVLSMMAGLMTI